MAGTIHKAYGVIETKTLIRTGPCIITAMKFINEDSAIRFLQVFDAAAIANVTLATTTADWCLVAGINGGEDNYTGSGLVFRNGIVVAATTTAIGGSGAAAAKCNVFMVIE